MTAKAPEKPIIHFYQHGESGSTHGFTHPLPKEIAKQVKAGILILVADEDGTDPATEIARLRAQVEAMAAASGIDPASLGLDGLADTASPSDEADEEEKVPGPDDEDDEDEDAGELHLCVECGEPVERKGRTGPWPQRHPGCK